MNSTLVIIPTYDERENLGPVVNRVLASGAAVDILVVDDNSPDGTGDLAEELAAAHPEISVLHRAGKEGLGVAYLAGFAWGLERDYSALVEMDADGSHHPEYLPEMIALLEDNDVVLGSRWIPGGSVENWSKYRELLSRGGNWYARRALGIGVADATGGFRVYRSTALRRIDLTKVASHGYCFQLDLVWRALQRGLRVVETPIVFTEREHGVSKMSGSIVRESLTKVTVWGMRRRLRSLLNLVVRRRRLPSVKASSHRVPPAPTPDRVASN
jgi:dolichol-phosphate mannosyltransferase